MKKYFLFTVIILMLVASVSGLSLDFQNSDGFVAQVACTTGTCLWYQNASGASNYIYGTGANAIFVSQTALPMQYAAITRWDGGGVFVNLRDSTGNLQGRIYYNMFPPAPPVRLELVVSGGTAHLLANGTAVGAGYTGTGLLTGSDHIPGLLQNPSYVSWEAVNLQVDDAIWGDTESKYIFGSPQDGYFLMKDFLNPSSSGFYKVNSSSPTGSTLIYSYTLPTTFSKGNGNNESVVLNNYGGGDYQTYYTGSLYAGEIQWNLTQFFNMAPAPEAPYGLYVTTIDGISPPKISGTIPYIGSGATVALDKSQYYTGDTATATMVVSDGYYDTGSYAYHFKITDIFGTEVYDIPVTFSASSPYTGTSSYTWLDSDPGGVYYGMLYATRLSDSKEILMNYDTCEVATSIAITGFVKSAETAAALASATVAITQGGSTDTLTSGFDGNYSTTLPFAVDVPTGLVASKAGYNTYTTVFTPAVSGALQINVTLMPTTPTHTGIALYGVVRSPPYNRTVDDATVTIYNASVGNFVVLTNSAGYYIQNSMPNGSLWDVWGSKYGFSNSTIYQKLVVGA